MRQFHPRRITRSRFSKSDGLNSTAIFAQSPAIAAERKMARRETMSRFPSMISPNDLNPALVASLDFDLLREYRILRPPCTPYPPATEVTADYGTLALDEAIASHNQAAVPR